MNNTQLDAALLRTDECSTVEFKSSFDPTKAGDWLEITKDIIALANSGGGIILIGVNDDGAPTGGDVSAPLSIDPADLTNRLNKYTNTQFHAFSIVACEKAGKVICAISVEGCRTPIVFTRVGTYEPEPGRQKNAFSVGTVYFRHGAKSEPATSDDLRHFLDRELEEIRHSWLNGIAKVVEAPRGSQIAVIPADIQLTKPGDAVALRLTDDPTAQAYYAVPIDNTHPYRQKEVIIEVNRILSDRKINAHDLLCIRRVYNINADISFCYTQNFTSPRYSEKFVTWILDQYKADTKFFENARTVRPEESK